MDLAAYRCNLEVLGGSDRWGRGLRPQAGLPGLELESRTQSLHEPQLMAAGHCRWP